MKHPNLILSLQAEINEIQKMIDEKEPVVTIDLLELKKEFESGIRIIKFHDEI